MFRIDDDPKFWATVTVHLPGEDAAQTFRARFKVMPVDDYRAIDFNTGTGVDDFLDEVFCDADDLQGADLKPVKFTEALGRKLSRQPHVRAALVKAYTETLASAARGN